jgi:hypothetical protein
LCFFYSTHACRTLQEEEVNSGLDQIKFILVMGSVGHDIRVVCGSTRLWHLLVIAGAFGVIHLHVILSTLLALALFLLIVALGVFDVNLLATGIGFGVFFVRGSSSVFAAGHRSILALYRSGLGLLFFVVLLLNAVLVAVGVQIGLGLLGRELWWGRFLGIPSAVSSV